MIIDFFKKRKGYGKVCIISLIKATIWRICATGITFSIMMIYGLQYDKSILFAVIDTTIKFISFYIFDLVWTIIYNTIKNIKKNKIIKNDNSITENNIETNQDTKVNDNTENI